MSLVDATMRPLGRIAIPFGLLWSSKLCTQSSSATDLATMFPHRLRSSRRGSGRLKEATQLICDDDEARMATKVVHEAADRVHLGGGLAKCGIDLCIAASHNVPADATASWQRGEHEEAVVIHARLQAHHRVVGREAAVVDNGGYMRDHVERRPGFGAHLFAAINAGLREDAERDALLGVEGGARGIAHISVTGASGCGGWQCSWRAT